MKDPSLNEVEKKQEGENIIEPKQSKLIRLLHLQRLVLVLG
jgi:hypothetical protein